MSSSMSTEQRVPLLNPNDREAQVAAVYVKRGDAVRAGDLICCLQTTKTSFEVEAEASGYVQRLHVSPGDTVTAEDPLCAIGDVPPAVEEAPAGAGERAGTFDGMRITKPARRLAEELGVSASLLPTDRLVTEALVRAAAGGDSARVGTVRRSGSAAVIFGGGGHARALIDLMHRTRSLVPYGIVDDAEPDTKSMGIPLLGKRDVLAQLLERGVVLAVNAVGAIGRMGIRIGIFEHLAEVGFGFPTLVHPCAVVEPGARLDDGAQVFALAYVGSDVTVGFGSIVNTGSVLSHDCVIGDYCHIAPGAILAGGVEVGRGTLVGSGVTTDLCVKIGEDVRIGNGARVLADVPSRTIVPAGSNWTGP